MSRRPVTVARLLLAGLLLFTAHASRASNGMNLIGFGAESLAMGGADLALTDSPASMNINPAGIGWCGERELDFGLSFLNPSLSHSDRLGNDRDDTLDRFPMPYLGYVHPTGRVVVGVGVFIQGGLGAEYENLVTPPSALASSGNLPPGSLGNSVIPDTDNVLTKLSHAKLTPTVAWRLSPQITLGAALSLSYARAEMKLFPETSVWADLDRSGTIGDGPRDSFFGMHADGVSALGYGLRLGVQYKRGALAVGAAYSTETDLDFEDGTMTLNLSALGLGKVDYDAEMTGFAWPRQAGLGVSYRFHPRLLIAGDLDWIDWSSAVATLAIEIDNPDQPLAPPSRTIPFEMNWDDQWVWALGAELQAGPSWVARVGFNHGDTPIPDSTLRPQFPAIAEDHLTAGVGYRIGPWGLDAALEYVLESEKTNSSPEPRLNPFGPGSRQTLSQVAFHFTVHRALSSRRSGADKS